MYEQVVPNLVLTRVDGISDSDFRKKSSESKGFGTNPSKRDSEQTRVKDSEQTRVKDLLSQHGSGSHLSSQPKLNKSFSLEADHLKVTHRFIYLTRHWDYR